MWMYDTNPKAPYPTLFPLLFPERDIKDGGEGSCRYLPTVLDKELEDSS